MSEWKEYKLEEIADLVKDKYLPKEGDTLNYVGLEHIQEQVLRLNSIGCSDDVISAKFKFKKGDILFGKLRPYFRKVIRPNFDGVCSTDIWVIRAKRGINQEYLFYLFASKGFVDLCNYGEAGTRMPRADWNFMSQTVWNIPVDQSEQRAIASVLSSLDDKIDLLHRENKTLEAMAETLFRQWFIEEAKDEWEKGVIPDEFDFTMGLAPPGESYNEEGIGVPLYQGNADFQFRFPKKRVYTTDPKRFAEKYDALISVRAPVGTINMADDKCCIGRGIAAFRYKNNNSFYTYTYYKLRSLMWEIQQFNDEGTVFGSINKRDFESFEIVIPPFNVIVQFQNFAKPLDDKIIVNSIQIRTLEKLRDTLLPKLMSGEVRVKYEEEEMGSCQE